MQTAISASKQQRVCSRQTGAVHADLQTKMLAPMQHSLICHELKCYKAYVQQCLCMEHFRNVRTLQYEQH